MTTNYYETYEIGTRTFFIDKIHGHYDVGYITGRGKTILGKSQDTPAMCYKIVLNFLDETTKKQMAYVPKVVRRFISRTIDA